MKNHYLEILNNSQIQAIEEISIKQGISGFQLMENAGKAVAQEVITLLEGRTALVLCGPGNNGGDGYVTARILKNNGIPVRVASLRDPNTLTNDAAKHFALWGGHAEHAGNISIQKENLLIIDALFGSGLTRPLTNEVLKISQTIAQNNLDCIAIDIPSGVNGNTGNILGGAIKASKTITFSRPKPGHFLYPGRSFCGKVLVKDIGISDKNIDKIAPQLFINKPKLWQKNAKFLHRHWTDHKYTRGHATVISGKKMPGAARLAAQAARRIGAGLVTITCPPDNFATLSAGEPGTLIKSAPTQKQLMKILNDRRQNAILVGPGTGLTKKTNAIVLQVLAMQNKTIVLDADALSIFEKNPNTLFSAIKMPCILTPHEAEFKRLFPMQGDRLSAVRKAAKLSGAIIILKGPDTIIASPSGDAAINSNAPPTLATAGTGDVLAGFVLGLLAQNTTPFDAACAAVWLHSEAANKFGNGLIAEDLPKMLPSVITSLVDSN